MRIQINKLGLEYPEYTFTEYKYSYDRYSKKLIISKQCNGDKLFHEGVERGTIVAYYCPTCGNEIYGLWKYRDPRLDSSLAPIYRYWPQDIKDDIQHRLREFEKKCLPIVEEYNRTLGKEITEIAALKKCPVCNGILSREEGFAGSDVEDTVLPNFFENNTIKINLPRLNLWKYSSESDDNAFNKLIDSSYDFMQTHRNNVEHMLAREKCEIICQEYNKSVSVQFPNKAIDSIKSSSENLLKYIQELINIENTIYSLKQRLNELYFQHIENDRKVYASSFTSQAIKYRVQNELYREFFKIEQKIDKCCEYIEEKKKVGITVANIEKPARPTYLPSKWYNKSKIEIENRKKRAEYQYAMEKYEAEIERLEEEFNREIDSLNTELASYEEERNQLSITAPIRINEKIESKKSNVCPEKVLKVLLDTEIENAENALKKLFEYRNELYEMNIVYEKYRDIVVLCSFCEYLTAGRCQALEGAHGAYNLYESELRADMIIAKLDRIVASLGSINNNQRLIYSELKKTTDSLNAIQNSMHTAVNSIQKIATNQTKTNEYLAEIAINNDYIAYNTAVDAYYSKVNAQLTNSLGYLVAMK